MKHFKCLRFLRSPLKRIVFKTHRFHIYALSLAFSKSSVFTAEQCERKAKTDTFCLLRFHMKTEQCELRLSLCGQIPPWGLNRALTVCNERYKVSRQAKRQIYSSTKPSHEAFAFLDIRVLPLWIASVRSHRLL